MEQERDEGTEPSPEWLRLAINNHFAESVDLPRDVRVGRSRILWADEGLFARRVLPEGRVLGTYVGEVIYKLSESLERARLSERLFDFVLWGKHSISVDAHRSWPGKMNHKWSWPYTGVHGNELLRFPFAGWEHFFANVLVDDDANLIATRFSGQPPADPAFSAAQTDEELTIDYGDEYWRSSETAPRWDLRDAPQSLLIAALRWDAQWRPLQQLAEKSHVMLRGDTVFPLSLQQKEQYNITLVAP